MPLKKYKIGVIGCGWIFDKHIEAIKTNSDKFELVCLCDIDEKKIRNRAVEYGVSGYTDYKKMLKEMKGKVDFISIATPNSLHYQQAIDALNSGCDVLIEKPIDFNHKRVQEISAHAKKIGRKAYAVLQVRYNPTVGMVKEALELGYLGTIRSVSLIQRWQRPESYFDSWRADLEVGGRTLYEVGIHYLDIVQLLFGLPDVKASASFNNKHKNVKFEDTVFSIFHFPSGASGSCEVTIASEPCNLECSISILGSEGFIKIAGRALDEIEKAMFLNNIYEAKWDALTAKHGKAISPISYGTHSGSCPNHPTLYAEIGRGRGIEVAEAINSIRFIEAIYSREIN